MPDDKMTKRLLADSFVRLAADKANAANEKNRRFFEWHCGEEQCRVVIRKQNGEKLWQEKQRED